MTDFFNNLLTSMSSKFNETNTDVVPINLNDDKTLKWRGLHNNQFSKKRKDCKRSSDKGDDHDGEQSDDGDVNADESSEMDAGDTSVVVDGENSANDKDQLSETTSSSTTTTPTPTPTATTSTAKVELSDQRVSRRLRRSHIDEVSAETSRKTGLRPKRQSSAGSVNESNRSLSPRVEKEVKQEKLDKSDKGDKTSATESPATVPKRNSIMTRQRGRANQSKNGTNDDLNESMARSQSERKSGVGIEGDGESSEAPSTKPTKSLRRSERTNANHLANDHKDTTASNESLAKTMDVDCEQNRTEKELITRSRKRTVDDRKVNDVLVKEEKPTPTKEVDEKPAGDVVGATVSCTVESKDETKDSVVSVENSENATVNEAIETNLDDRAINGNGTEVQPARKRGRRQGFVKSRSGLRLTASIGTRNAPAKKSPRFSPDESPFVYSISKKDKLAAEQLVSFHDLFQTFTNYFHIFIVKFPINPQCDHCHHWLDFPNFSIFYLTESIRFNRNSVSHVA